MDGKTPEGGCSRCRELEAKLDVALKAIEVLTTRVRDLEAQVKRNSRNSGQPPSADPPGAPPRTKKGPTGNKPGGQPGHEAHLRRLVDPDQVTERRRVLPTQCGRCAASFGSGVVLVGEPVRHQVVDLPESVAQVTEYELHVARCNCGKMTRATLPCEAPRGCVGPRLQAFLGLLVGIGGTSRRDAHEVLTDMLGIDLSLGTISQYEEATSAALAAPCEEIREAISRSPVAHVDETGWRERGKRRWLWVAATSTLSYFRVEKTRGRESFESLLGTNFDGIVISDRWTAYNHLDARKRGLCWAHLKRDFQKLVDRGGPAKPLGDWGLKEVKHLFESWRRFREGKSDREKLATDLRPVKARVGRLLRRCVAGTDAKARRFASNLQKLWSALWTFSSEPGVEPTNNKAERDIRKPVIWRKISFGSASDRGSRFVERILTIVQTLRAQGRGVFQWLVARLSDYHRDVAGPSLLPPPAPVG